jgi:hypothetical protein
MGNMTQYSCQVLVSHLKFFFSYFGKLGHLANILHDHEKMETPTIFSQRPGAELADKTTGGTVGHASK